MSYGLRTGRGVSGIGYTHVRGYRMRGFGDVVAGGTQLVPLPAYANCDPRDTACVNANEALNTAYNAQVIQAEANNNAQQCLLNANNATSDAQRAQVLQACQGQYLTQGGAPSLSPFIGGPGAPTPVAGPTSVAVRPGTFSFTTSRGSNSLQVGDTWQITITGATPGLQVATTGTMPSGSYPRTVEGMTDSNGNFSKSGTVGSGDIGSWAETWTVGNATTGSVNFTVSAASSSPANPPGAPAAGPGYSAPALNNQITLPSTFLSTGGFDLSSIPWWGWAGAAAVAVFAFGGKH